MDSFCRYGGNGDSITLDELKQLQRETGSLFAHAENSGCEGCYVEVARYNNAANCWQRFAFLKCFGGEHASNEDASAEETARLFAAEISPRACDSFIHSLPNYEAHQ